MKLFITLLLLSFITFTLTSPVETEKKTSSEEEKLDFELKKERVPLKTDDDVIEREERSISLSEGYTDEEKKLIEAGTVKFGFQAEVPKIMKIIVESLYSNKEVFLREVISNASDALDKIRFEALTNPEALGETPQLEIRILADAEKGVLIIQDSGIGMTRQELIDNLGTIAQSGTKEFAEALAKGSASNLIGQFGVGFYSTFLVADTVTVITKNNADDKQWIWQSAPDNSYTIAEDPKGNTLGRGTSISLQMKNDPEAREYLNESKLKELLKKYSEFISFPIYLYTSHVETKEVPVPEEEQDQENIVDDDDEDDDEEEDDEDDDEDEEEEEEEEKPKTKTVEETVWEWELINSIKPIWTRDKNDITEEEYISFFKSVTKSDEDPLTYMHFVAEGDVEFKALIFLPSTPPHGQFDPTIRQRGVKLYVKKVFITDDFDAIIPKYLGFLRGVVDSESIPLNVSREMLQQHKGLDAIKKKLIRKAIAMFQVLSEDEEKYATFWSSYGTNVKLGVVEDSHNRSRLAKLLRYTSSKTGKLTSFDDYVSRMKEGQDQIYYLAGDSVESMKKSPLLEKLLTKGYEVLFMTEPIDEYTMQNLTKYESKYRLTNVAKEGLDFNQEKEEEDNKDYDEELRAFSDFIKSKFGSRIGRVKISNRLIKSPCALVAETWGYTATMERVAKAQALADQSQTKSWIGKKVLEINPTHPIIVELNRMVKEDPESEQAMDTSSLLIEAAAISSGYSIENPADFVNRIYDTLGNKLDVTLPSEEESSSDETNDSAEPVVVEDDIPVGFNPKDEL